jgi:hypothetical protein
MPTPPPDEEPDEDDTLKQMLKDLANATDKYEAAIAMQPEANRPFNTQANKQSDHHNNKNRNPNTSANQAGGRVNEDEDDYESDNIEDRDIDNLKKLRTNPHSHTNNRGVCIDDFITYHVTPELQRRPTYEECLHDQNEVDPLQLNAAMIQPTISELEKGEAQPENQIQSTSEIRPKIEAQPHTNSIGTWLLASTADNRNAEIMESSSSLTP